MFLQNELWFCFPNGVWKALKAQQEVCTINGQPSHLRFCQRFRLFWCFHKINSVVPKHWQTAYKKLCGISYIGFICPFVVNDPTDLGATIVVAQALCLSIFNLSPTQKTCLFTYGNKANVSVEYFRGPSSWSDVISRQLSQSNSSTRLEKK